MGEETLLDKIRGKIGSMAWKVFIWSIRMTQEQYWRAIYEQEKALLP